MYEALKQVENDYKTGQFVICLVSGKRKKVGSKIMVHEFFNNLIISEKPYCVLHKREENLWAEKV